MTEPASSVFQQETDESPTTRHYQPEAMLVHVVESNVGDDRPHGADKGATCSRAGAATTCVANGPMSTSEFRTVLQSCIQSRDLFRFEFDADQQLTIPDADLLHRVQREAGARGDAETAGRAHRMLDYLEGNA